MKFDESAFSSQMFASNQEELQLEIYKIHEIKMNIICDKISSKYLYIYGKRI